NCSILFLLIEEGLAGFAQAGKISVHLGGFHANQRDPPDGTFGVVLLSENCRCQQQQPSGETVNRFHREISRNRIWGKRQEHHTLRATIRKSRSRKAPSFARLDGSKSRLHAVLAKATFHGQVPRLTTLLKAES